MPENAQSAEGTRTAIVWNEAESAKVVVSARPVYEAAARGALLVARELAERTDCPAGFQALSSIARSTEFALEALDSSSVVTQGLPRRPRAKICRLWSRLARRGAIS